MTIQEAFEKCSNPASEDTLPFMRKIMAECPDLTDGWKLLCAADEMMMADDVGEELSVAEALERVKDEVEPTPEELAQQIKDAEAKADILFPPKPGVEPPKTMREFFERVFGPDEEPEEDSGHFDELHARVAKNILRRQAGELVREECFDSIAVGPEGAEPWSITVAFRPGELSKEAQLTLEKMKHNSHKSQLGTTKGITGVSFMVYSK